MERAVSRLALPDSPVDPTHIGELINQMADGRQLIHQPGYCDPTDISPPLLTRVLLYGASPCSRPAAFAEAPVAVDLPRVQPGLIATPRNGT